MFYGMYHLQRLLAEDDDSFASVWRDSDQKLHPPLRLHNDECAEKNTNGTQSLRGDYPCNDQSAGDAKLLFVSVTAAIQIAFGSRHQPLNYQRSFLRFRRLNMHGLKNSCADEVTSFSEITLILMR